MAPKKSSYDELKEFQGKRYTGMKVGRRHKWYYDQGEWSERKVTPDKWEFRYAVTKRRAGKAPEGSGVPVGTAYRWYIMADQVVTKVDANSYTTEMIGLKHKIAHRRADKDRWNASDSAQRKRLIAVLREMIAELEKPPAEAPADRPAAGDGGTVRPGAGGNGDARKLRGGRAAARGRIGADGKDRPRRDSTRRTAGRPAVRRASGGRRSSSHRPHA